jgi:condensin complex subunit 2
MPLELCLMFGYFKIPQINKIEVQYDKTSKQVDVQALKFTIWNCIQEIQESVQLPLQVC